MGLSIIPPSSISSSTLFMAIDLFLLFFLDAGSSFTQLPLLASGAGAGAGAGELVCEDLPPSVCAFAVSSAGFRCMLEKKIIAENAGQAGAAAAAKAEELIAIMALQLNTDAVTLSDDDFVVDHASAAAQAELECQTSTVSAGRHVHAERIESDECVHMCGVERLAVGLSSDAFAEPGFSHSLLCSLPCHNNCPNLLDLFSDLASCQGTSLAQLCSLDFGSGGEEMHSNHQLRRRHRHREYLEMASLPRQHHHHNVIDNNVPRPRRQQRVFEEGHDSYANAPSPF